MEFDRNPTLDALCARKSVRVFTEEPVPQAVKNALFQAAMQAPTAGNQMLYTILDITDAALKARLADLCDHQAVKDTLADTCDHQPFIADAPVVLVFVADCQRWYDGFAAAGCAPRPPREGDLLLAAADAAIAAQNTVVAAESFGLGSCYIGDILENCEDVRSALALPPYAVPAAMLVLGRPTQQQRERRKPARFDARYIVRENRYRRMTPEEHEAMYRAREAAEGRADVDYAARMQAFCARKYNSVFSREMSRSAAPCGNGLTCAGASRPAPRAGCILAMCSALCWPGFPPAAGADASYCGSKIWTSDAASRSTRAFWRRTWPGWGWIGTKAAGEAGRTAPIFKVNAANCTHRPCRC